MNIHKIIIKTFLLLAILSGISLTLINFFELRSLWLDEAFLALNIVNKEWHELLKPLDYQQVAPIGFLLIEKAFAFLFGDTDWSLRILPMISYSIAISFIYALSKRIFKEEIFSLFSVAIFSFSYYVIYFASEVKQYMSDVAIALVLLFYVIKFIENKQEEKYHICLLVGVIAVWFSNIAIIILFSSCLFFLYKAYEQKNGFKEIAILGCCWFISFSIYYYLFVLNHPTRPFMLSYWENKGAFLPKNIFTVDFIKALYQKIRMLFSLSGRYSYSPILIPLFLIGVFHLFKKRKDILLLLVLPICVHLTLSYLRLYPFDRRLILYLMPILIILIVLGVVQISSFLNKTGQNLFYYLLPLPFIFSLMILRARGFPIERNEIKKSLTYLHKNIQDGDDVYVAYGASRAFAFYKNDYQKIYNSNRTNVLIGKYTEDWSEYEQDIKQIRRPVWILFSHKFTSSPFDEEEYILDLFEKEHFKIIDAQEYTGSSIYKAVVL